MMPSIRRNRLRACMRYIQPRPGKYQRNPDLENQAVNSPPMIRTIRPESQAYSSTERLQYRISDVIFGNSIPYSPKILRNLGPMYISQYSKTRFRGNSTNMG